MSPNESSLLPFFTPRGIVVIGASTSPSKLGYGVARNLISSRYQGAVHFVSQKSGELFGKPIYADLADVPDPVELAVLVVPSSAMPQTLESCAKRGIRAAIIMSAGFREAGSEGAALEQECLAIARAHNIRLLGPNCIGTIDTHLPLDTTFLQPPIPSQGGVGLISHSGAFCAATVDWARHQGFGFSKIVSLGNQADVNETDVLPLVATDQYTRVVVLYMEGVTDGQRFVRVARQVTEHKPVIAIKVGRFESGQKAATSHTGALAGSDIAYDAAFTKAGILRAESTEQVFDWARALEKCPLPEGAHVAILTDAGGPGVIAADALDANGLHLAVLSNSTEQALGRKLPPAANIHNPVDMLASAMPQDYAECLKLLLDDPSVNSALVVLLPPPMSTAESVADAIIPVIKSSHKPVVIALLGSTLIERAQENFRRANLPTFPFPERAASALGALNRRITFLNSRTVSSPSDRPFSINQVRHDVNAEELLSSYGIPVSPSMLASSINSAVQLARQLTFPLVMKIASPDISHKSDFDGVLLNIKTVSAVRRGYAQLIRSLKSLNPNARIDGVYLQQQVSDGQEVIVGVTRDATFGPLVMFGTGGIEAEGYNDVAFALAPLDLKEAEELIFRTWAGRRLKGFRNLPPADISSVMEVLMRISWLAYEHTEIKEMEINPLRVFTKGAIALDSRMKLDSVIGGDD